MTPKCEDCSLSEPVFPGEKLICSHPNCYSYCEDERYKGVFCGPTGKLFKERGSE